jgi:catechol 2,3-dioxygenase-like lactoylglutathione lyase family enzyme
MEINGIAHVHLTVNQFESCKAFYEQLLPFLGMTPVMQTDGVYYCVGGRTGLLITPSEERHRAERFVQTRIGLHHLCFRAKSREDVDSVHRLLVEIGAKVVHPPEDGPWAPGYYSVLFEDPDGIRLEVNFVPGKGLFATPGKTS